MKKLFAITLAALLAATVFVSCQEKEVSETDTDNKASVTANSETETDVEEAAEAAEEAEEAEEEVLPEGWTYSPKKIIGAWDMLDPMYGVYSGYRFNEDGTIDALYNRMYEAIGTYECREDGVHYSQDGGATWDPLVMVVKSITDTELTIEFDGVETVLTKYEGEITEYMPEGWTYVEGTDEEIGAATGAEAAE